LLERAQHVPIHPTLGNLTVCNAIDRDPRPCRPTPCRRDTHYFAVLRTSGNKVRCDQIAFCNLRNDLVLKIWKRLMKRRNELFPGTESANCFGAVRMMMLMIHIISRKDFSGLSLLPCVQRSIARRARSL